MSDDCTRRMEALDRLSQTPGESQHARLRLTDEERHAVLMGVGSLLEGFILHGRQGDRLAAETLRGLLARSSTSTGKGQE